MSVLNKSSQGASFLPRGMGVSNRGWKNKKSWLKIFCFSLANVAMLFFSPLNALAQSEGSTQFLRSLRNLDSEEVEKIFGPADRQEELSDQRVSWWYGKSIIFFSQGRVYAWSDGGDLNSRRNLHQIKSKTSSEKNNSSQLWANDWTPPNKAQLEDGVLKQMLGIKN